MKLLLERKKDKNQQQQQCHKFIPAPALPALSMLKTKMDMFFPLPHASIGSVEEKILVASHVPARGVSCLFLCLLNFLRHGGRVTVDPLQTAEMVVEDLDDLRQLFFTISLAPFIF